jgi:hypothetical protein
METKTESKKKGVKRGFIGGLVQTIALIIIGVLVAFTLYNELAAQASNLTGLWSTTLVLLGIIVPVVFILMTTGLLGGGGRK